VFSNSIAIVAAGLSNWRSSLWYLDSAGAIAISIYIAVSWLETGKEQVERLIGLRT
jgi:divalent metal cation (Fe/Co/Zn/Cd) transporter